MAARSRRPEPDPEPEAENPRYLITGGAGFVGSNLARALQESQPDAALLIVDDFRTGTFENLVSDGPTGWSYRGEVIARPLNDFDLLDLIDEFQPHVVFHEASITDTTVTDQAKMIDDNVEPFEYLVRGATEMAYTLVWASSAATYGTRANGATGEKRPFRVEDAGHPANVYGFSKWVMENIHRRAQAEHPEARLVGLRYFNVFGPGEQNKGHMASMIYQLARQILAGKRPRIFYDGEQARDHVHVTDVVEATLAAAGDNVPSGIYNVGSGRTTTFNQIIAALNEALGSTLETDYFENPYAFYQDYTCADLAATKRALRWQPRIDPAEGIKDYARWLREREPTAARGA